MPATVEFIFDFASPNAYLAWRVLAPILQRTGAKLDVKACLLGGIFKATGNKAPMAAFAGVTGKLAYEALETRRFIAAHGISRFRRNPHFPVITLLLMRGLTAAQMMGEADAYAEAPLVAMWEDGLKMDDPDVFTRALDKVGLDGAALLAATQESAVKAHLIAETEAAVTRGVLGIPTFFVSEEMFFGKGRLGQVENELLAASCSFADRDVIPRAPT